MRDLTYATALVGCGLVFVLMLAGCPQESTEMAADEIVAIEPPATGGEALPEGQASADAQAAPDQSAEPATGVAADAAPAASGSAQPAPQSGGGQQATTQPSRPAPSTAAPSGSGSSASSGQRRSGAGAGQGGGTGQGGDGQRRMDPFERFDENGDGALVASELPDEFKERMMQADANSDGKITRAEWDQAMAALREGAQAAAGERRRRSFERMDESGDGVLSGSEIPERMRERMAQIDANGDGKLSREEFEASRPQRPAGGGAGGGGGRGPGGQ